MADSGRYLGWREDAEREQLRLVRLEKETMAKPLDLDALLHLHDQAFRLGVTLPLGIIKVMEEVPILIRRLQSAEAENARLKHDLDAAIEALTVAGLARVEERVKGGT